MAGGQDTVGIAHTRPSALCTGTRTCAPSTACRMVQRCTIRQAVLGAQVRVPVHKALGRVCAMPTVSCPPAIPVAVSGEEITPAAIALMQRYGIEELSVLR